MNGVHNLKNEFRLGGVANVRNRAFPLMLATECEQGTPLWLNWN